MSLGGQGQPQIGRRISICWHVRSWNLVKRVLPEQATGLDAALNNDTAMMTVFVPVNAAFDALAMQMNQSLGAILAQTDMLKQVHLQTLIPPIAHRHEK